MKTNAFDLRKGQIVNYNGVVGVIVAIDKFTNWDLDEIVRVSLAVNKEVKDFFMNYEAEVEVL